MKRIVFITAIWLPSLLTFGQCLEERVSLFCTQCSIDEALDRLEAQVSCSFSYNARNFDAAEFVDLQLDDVKLREAVKKATADRYQIKERGRHVILIEKRNLQEQKSKKQEYIIEGYIRNSTTGQVVQNATVYAVENKYSALSDAAGYYRIQLVTDEEQFGLSYSRQSFFDTIIVVSPAIQEVRQDIQLMPHSVAPPTIPTMHAELPQRVREVEQLPMVKLLVPDVQAQRAMNLEFLEDIPVQFSLTPSMGTNKLTSGMSNNLFSVNLLGGYNAGVRGLEAGVGVNIIRQNVTGIQGAGIGNIVGGEVRGIQAAGIFNNVRGSVKGLQAGGIYNIVLDTIIGCQAGGVFNILNGSITGAQIGGVFNIATESMSGLQASGVFNITQQNVKFAQIAGVFNLAGTVTGFQAAGLFNHANDSVTGTQLAGFSNTAMNDVEGVQIAGFGNLSGGELSGVQLAGFGNYARDVKGDQYAGAINISRDVNRQVSGLINIGRTVDKLQLGFINFSDSAARSFGFLSFSRKGVNSIDLFADEVSMVNVSYHTGSKFFYNILQVGFGSYTGLSIFSYGYGFGTDIGDPENRMHLHLEFLVRQLDHLAKPKHVLNLNLKFDPSISIRLGKKRPTLVFGPSFNLLFRNGLLQNTDTDNGAVLVDIPSQPPIFKPMEGVFDGRAWLGGRLGLRF
ncbi:MAG: carboxypeptidase regulatory-like domain-containing protein [Flavobacteriales bacterium]|nr:carboxypeptidase regulatory-like domain-containing protein [Flavobacteriales bacterium]